MRQWTAALMLGALGLAVLLYVFAVPVFAAEADEWPEEAREYIVGPDIEPELPAPPTDSSQIAEDVHALRYFAEMLYEVWLPLGAAVWFLRGVYRWFYEVFIEPAI